MFSGAYTILSWFHVVVAIAGCVFLAVGSYLVLECNFSFIIEEDVVHVHCLMLFTLLVAVKLVAVAPPLVGI